MKKLLFVLIVLTIGLSCTKDKTTVSEKQSLYWRIEGQENSGKVFYTPIIATK